jgi:hypothetical protein
MINRILTSLVLACALTLNPGCAALGGAKDASSGQQAAHVAFGLVKTAMTFIEVETTKYIDGVKDPSPEDLASAEEMVKRLERAKTALDLAEQYATGEKADEANLKTYIADAADSLTLVAEELRSHDVNIPTVITDGLAFAAAYARSA